MKRVFIYKQSQSIPQFYPNFHRGLIGAAANSSFYYNFNGYNNWAWGQNGFGTLGDNTNVNKCLPVSFVGATHTFCKVKSGFNHSCFIDNNGQAWSWGGNSTNYGELGDNSVLNKSTPVSVWGNRTFCEISAGYSHTLALDNQGRIWGWGSDFFNTLLGSGNKSTPILISAGGLDAHTFCSVVAADFYSFALDTNGVAAGWGGNTVGELGGSGYPVYLSAHTFCHISMGYSLSFGLDQNGQAWSWGLNVYGQLGNNSVSSQTTPVSVWGNHTFCKINTGNNSYTTYAIDNHGQIWSWGRNDRGQLGIDSTTGACTPVSVWQGNRTFCDIRGGGKHALAIEWNGKVWGWGYNNSGQLDNNSIISQRTPVLIIDDYLRIT